MKTFGTRPTYQIFAVVTLVTGIIYLIFNMTYLKKRSQLEGNDIVKKKSRNIDVQISFDKHANDISLDEKPQDERMKEDKSISMENDGLDNKEFLKELQDNKLSKKQMNKVCRLKLLETLKTS